MNSAANFGAGTTNVVADGGEFALDAGRAVGRARPGPSLTRRDPGLLPVGYWLLAAGAAAPPPLLCLKN